jgi:hypothetical protein
MHEEAIAVDAGVSQDIDRSNNCAGPPQSMADRSLDTSSYCWPSQSPDCDAGLSSHVIVAICSKPCKLSNTEEARPFTCKKIHTHEAPERR